MKIKEILKNKWAWLGAIIGGVLNGFILHIKIPLPNLPIVSCRGLGSPLCDNSIPSTIIYSIIIGFIIGLITEKLWRKFK